MHKKKHQSTGVVGQSWLTMFLNKQIPYTESFRKQLLIALLLGCLLALIMIFLGPFDTDRFQHEHKSWILGGFGALFSFIYMILARLEGMWYRSLGKKWTIKHEIAMFITLLLVSSIPIHFYNQVLLNNLFVREYTTYDYINHGFWFFKQSLLPINFMLLPFYIYLRNKLGTLVAPESLNAIEIFGMNKGERVKISRDDVLFVKSSENYVEIFFRSLDGVQKHTFRNTLTAIHMQAPFLRQCHRSYLVNLSSIKKVSGNSQNAQLEFYDDNLRIPLSYTYYKTITSSLSS